MSLWDYIVWPFAKLMMLLYNWTTDYGVSVILFAFVVNLVLLPFMGKSKKSMMRTSRLQPKIMELQKRHEGNQQKLQQEMQKLYMEEGVKPMSGCFWSLIPFPILIALYSVIRQPLVKMMGIATADMEKIKEWATANAGFVSGGRGGTYDEIGVVNSLHEHFTDAVNALGDFGEKLIDIDYSFLGMNLGKVPEFRIWNTDFSDPSIWLPALGLFTIPLIAAFLSWLSMKISQMTNPPAVTQQQNATAASMKSMNILMPIMSIWICFVMPAALGIYWIANSVFGIVRDLGLTKLYQKQLDEEDAERLTREKERELEFARRREESERLRAEGIVDTTNTSKKKIQAQQKHEREERRNAQISAEREARRERLGIVKENNPSQVGNRKYARGRAYDPDRFAYVRPEADVQTIPELEIEAAPETDEES